MNILSTLQKIIFEKLQNIENVTIYTCPETNSTFPYITINMENVEIENNFSQNTYIIYFNISVFDKNESNLHILDLSNTTKEYLMELSNTQLNDFNIIDIYFNNLNLKLFNEINSVWNAVLKFNIIIQSKK